MPQVNVEDLRTWLTEHKPVTVLDVRTDEDRAQWSIPSSMHANVYEALKAGRPNAIVGLDIPSDRPVVTVCNRGKVSRIAAEQLQAQGFESFSLEGGMQAWSLAWNVAAVPISTPDVEVLQIRRTGKGCLSYLIASSREAAVIDASVDSRVYIGLAAERGWRIRYVLDTHIHADHLSRSKLLAMETGSRLLLPKQDRVQFDFHPISDGDTIQIGSARLIALRTPGHTAESMCYLLDGGCLFTGDTLFLGAVGRPDLHANQEEARQRAARLFDSLCRLRSLPPDLLVLPGHASEPIPFDGIPLTDQIGNVWQRLGDWLLSKSTFIDRLITRLPAAPPNYQHIVELNESGADAQELNVTELEAGANRCAVS